MKEGKTGKKMRNGNLCECAGEENIKNYFEQSACFRVYERAEMSEFCVVIVRIFSSYSCISLETILNFFQLFFPLLKF